MTTRRDWPQNAYRPGLPAGSANLSDTGCQELISLAAVATFPTGTRNATNGNSGVPNNAYDMRYSRGVTIQLSSYGVTGTPTVAVQASLDGLAYSVIPVYQGGAFVNSFTIPTGGTAAAPNATLIVIDTPWFQWLQVAVTAAGTAGSAYLTIAKRE